MTQTVKLIQAELATLADPDKAAHAQLFFKTGPGQYGHGDIFRGIRVPILRQLSRQLVQTSLGDLTQLLKSPYHEDRLLSLLTLVLQYKKGDEQIRTAIFDLYLAHTRYVNNWDLVDSSAYLIVGPHLQNRERQLLDQLAGSSLLWERRIAMIATMHFIRNGDFDDALRIAGLLVNDDHDLMHKAVGWMLREVGNKDRAVEEAFLQRHYQQMPRTMLRYAIEKFPEELRQDYLKGRI